MLKARTAQAQHPIPYKRICSPPLVHLTKGVLLVVKKGLWEVLSHKWFSDKSDFFPPKDGKRTILSNVIPFFFNSGKIISKIIKNKENFPFFINRNTHKGILPLVYLYPYQMSGRYPKNSRVLSLWKSKMVTFFAIPWHFCILAFFFCSIRATQKALWGHFLRT